MILNDRKKVLSYKILTKVAGCLLSVRMYVLQELMKNYFLGKSLYIVSKTGCENTPPPPRKNTLIHYKTFYFFKTKLNGDTLHLLCR